VAEALKSRDEFLQWTWRLHDTVNKSLKKASGWTEAQTLTYYQMRRQPESEATPPTPPPTMTPDPEVAATESEVAATPPPPPQPEATVSIPHVVVPTVAVSVPPRPKVLTQQQQRPMASKPMPLQQQYGNIFSQKNPKAANQHNKRPFTVSQSPLPPAQPAWRQPQPVQVVRVSAPGFTPKNGLPQPPSASPPEPQTSRRGSDKGVVNSMAGFSVPERPNSLSLRTLNDKVVHSTGNMNTRASIEATASQGPGKQVPPKTSGCSSCGKRAKARSRSAPLPK
jgi:hypothetical protein